MVTTKKILILEDDLETISKLTHSLHLLEYEYAEQGIGIDFAVTVFSEYTAVEKFINKNLDEVYDVILLDRDCKLAGSFHILDIENIGAEKIISISSVPLYNSQAEARGINNIVHKNYQDLDTFSGEVIENIKLLLKI